MDPVVHFEMPAEDAARMCKFYESAFGWKTTQLGSEMGNYVMADTTDTDANRMVTRPGTINGGFFQKSAPEQVTRVTIAVADIEDAFDKVEAAGGRVLGGQNGERRPDMIPGVGLYALIIDTEGNRVSLLQPVSR